MKDEFLIAHSEDFSGERIPEGKGILYSIFPEERDPETLSERSEMIRKFGVALYIHKNGHNHFFNSINNTRAKIASIIQEENPEIYSLIVTNKISPEKLDQTTFKNFPDHENFQRYVISLHEIMKDHTQVIITLQMLQDARQYLTDLQNPEKRVASRYISYHLSSYFNEVFILLERMGSLLKTIKRLYGREARFYKFSEHFETLHNIPTKTFNGIRKERNYHVHETRYTDKELEELQEIEFLMQFDTSGSQLMKPQYVEKLDKYHKQTRERLEGLSNTFDEMFNLFFGILERFIFSEQGDFIPPEETRKGRKS